MKKGNNKMDYKTKLDESVIDFLRKKGGFHSTKKGNKGYKRSKAKEDMRRGK